MGTAQAPKHRANRDCINRKRPKHERALAALAGSLLRSSFFGWYFLCRSFLCSSFLRRSFLCRRRNALYCLLGRCCGSACCLLDRFLGNRRSLLCGLRRSALCRSGRFFRNGFLRRGRLFRASAPSIRPLRLTLRFCSSFGADHFIEVASLAVRRFLLIDQRKLETQAAGYRCLLLTRCFSHAKACRPALQSIA